VTNKYKARASLGSGAKAILSRLPPTVRTLAKTLVKTVVRQSLGRLRPSPGRLSGKLALDGGKPVRDVMFRPWASYHSANFGSWLLCSHPQLRKIFLTGIEGLPQPLAQQFAQEWAQYCGCCYGLLLPHGTDALRIALAAVLDHDGLDYGGEVIVPNLSFIASATAALDRRFGVVFVDVEPDTLLIDPKRVEEAIIPGKTRAIMAVHLFGQPAGMRALLEIAKRHDLKIVEDAAQAHGAALEIGPAGALADAAGFSFQSSKNLACGEGGALTTNDEQVFERAYLMHNVGRPRVGGDRWAHVKLGWNCRPTEYQAALLLERFRRFEREQAIRRKNFFKLGEMIEELACVEPLSVRPDVRRHGVHMFVMRYHPEYCGGLSLPDFCRAAQAEGLPVSRGYAATLANQPALQNLIEKRRDYFRLMPTPVAERAAQQTIYIPQKVFLGTEADMAEIVAALRKIQNHYAPGAERQTPSAAKPDSAETHACAIEITEKFRPLACGVIGGAGFMGRKHVEVLTKHRFASVAALTDVNPRARRVAQAVGCAWFDSPQQMITSGKLDAIIVATPHWHHAELSIAALRAGLHVICEKPLTVTVSQADEVLRVAKESKGLFVVVHQNRFEPTYQQAKRILESGELGALLRCSMVEAMWRSQAYYDSSPWRGTWKGEGGGVLLNQAPHALDRYAWLCGMPSSVNGLCDVSIHRIEVEDSASAVFRHSGGAHGYIHVNTNECPPVARTVIACDRGRMVIERGALHVTRLRRSICEATRTEGNQINEIEGETRDFGGALVDSIPELLELFYENVGLAAAGKAKLVCPGEEGRNAVELANAIILSSFRGEEVDLPLNRVDYDQFVSFKINGIPAVSPEKPAGILNALR
jgi:dTDP-4-amino-4,6-dideoxygalactose transaminase/predicted dehydrogenase